MNSIATMFIPELGMIEPRRCHEHFPMKPRSLVAFPKQFGVGGKKNLSGPALPAPIARGTCRELAETEFWLVVTSTRFRFHAWPDRLALRQDAEWPPAYGSLD